MKQVPQNGEPCWVVAFESPDKKKLYVTTVTGTTRKEAIRNWEKIVGYTYAEQKRFEKRKGSKRLTCARARINVQTKYPEALMIFADAIPDSIKDL